MALPSPAYSSYATIGWPNPRDYRTLVDVLVECSDFLEAGVPTPRPIYDGPVIRETHREALRHIQSWREALRLLGEAVGGRRPVVLMAYMSDHLDHFEELVVAAGNAGARCILLPDLPFEHPDKVWFYIDSLRGHGLELCFFASSRFPHRWLQFYAAQRPLLVYLGLQPATGVKLPIAVEKNVRLARMLLGDTYLLAGFAIRTPELARRLIEVGADAVVVGSALVRAYREGGVEAVKRLACGIRDAVRSVGPGSSRHRSAWKTPPHPPA